MEETVDLVVRGCVVEGLRGKGHSGVDVEDRSDMEPCEPEQAGKLCDVGHPDMQRVVRSHGMLCRRLSWARRRWFRFFPVLRHRTLREFPSGTGECSGDHPVATERLHERHRQDDLANNVRVATGRWIWTHEGSDRLLAGIGGDLLLPAADGFSHDSEHSTRLGAAEGQEMLHPENPKAQLRGVVGAAMRWDPLPAVAHYLRRLLVKAQEKLGFLDLALGLQQRVIGLAKVDNSVGGQQSEEGDRFPQGTKGGHLQPPGPDGRHENSLRERVMDTHDASGMGGFYRLEEAYNPHFHPRNTGVTATVRNLRPPVNPSRTYPSRGASEKTVGSILS